MSHTQEPAAARTQRMAWVDIIKAAMVVLVVLVHVTPTLNVAVDGSAIYDFWAALMVFLEPLRMPVFFVMSGILASSAVKRPWSHTKSRTVGILYLYLIWHTLMTMFQILLDLLSQGYVEGGLATVVPDYFFDLFLTPDRYWYFYALVLYFVIARLLRNVNPWIVVGVAACINLAGPQVTEFLTVTFASVGGPGMLPSVVLNAVYFFAGVYFVQFFKAYAKRNDSRMLVASASVAVIGSLARIVSPEFAAVSFLPIAIAWVLTAILVAVRLQDNEKVAAFGAYVGPRTLPIFVIHFFLFDLLSIVIGVTGGDVLASSPMLQLIYPVVITLLMVLFSLWLYEKAMAHPVSSLLFKAPKSWTAKPVPAQTSTAQAPVQASSPPQFRQGEPALALPNEAGLRRG